MAVSWHTEAVFAIMRDLGAEAERYHAKSRALMPRYGEVAAGGAHMDDFFRGNALDEFLQALRKGHGPDSAASLAKKAAAESVRKWNQHRGDDYQTHRWEGTADDLIERGAARVRAVIQSKQGELFWAA